MASKSKTSQKSTYIQAKMFVPYIWPRLLAFGHNTFHNTMYLNSIRHLITRFSDASKSWDEMVKLSCRSDIAWWRHQMETFFALLAICTGNSPASGEFPAQRPVTRSFDVFFDLCLNKRLRKQSWGWWFETLSRPLWRHCNGKGISFAVLHLSSIKKIWHLHT